MQTSLKAAVSKATTPCDNTLDDYAYEHFQLQWGVQCKLGLAIIDHGTSDAQRVVVKLLIEHDGATPGKAEFIRFDCPTELIRFIELKNY